MTNYLSSIAARALHPVPPVRPRLRGRFDPGPLINEPVLDRVDVTPAPAIASWPPVENDRRTAFENQQGPRHAQPSQMSHAAIERYTFPPPSRDSEGSSDSQRDISELPPQSTTIQMPIAKVASPKITLPVSVVETGPIASRIEQAKEIEPAIQTTTEIISTDVRESNRDTQTQPHVATSRPVAITSDSTPLQHREERPLIEPRTDPDPTRPPHQREIKTIVVREREIIERPKEAREPSPKALPVPVISPSSQPKDGDAKPSPVVVQSRIAPLVEKWAESSSLGRPAPQPQPIVRVTIGRIEVRAVHSSQSQSPSKPRATPPVMNLDDYLQRRSQGGTR